MLVRRLLFRTLLMIVASTVCLAIRSSALRAAQTWTVAVGGGVPGARVVANTFQPRTIEVSVGDTVTYVFTQPWAVHTVTFLSEEKRPELDVVQGNQVIGNPRANFPSGGDTYDGTGYRNSGIKLRDPAQRRPYSLTFTRPGTYEYVCLVHPGMNGTVIVKERATGTPAEAEARGRSELQATLELGRKAFLQLKPEKKGNAAIVALVGDANTGWSIFRFTAQPLVIERGTTVTWEMRDPLEVHTVTFPSGEPVPLFTLVEPQPQGPPKLLRNPRVWNRIATGTYDGTGYVNSGILFPPGVPGNPPTTFSLTFTKAGRYEYWCVIHAPEVMRGTIVVK